MPALFAAPSDATFTPLAQLGAGPEGTVVLAQRGGKLVEIHSPTFEPAGDRWAELSARVRAVGAVDHPAVRPVLALETAPPAVILEGDSLPPLAEVIEQGVEPTRGLAIALDLARALAAAHRVGVFHGRVHPWSVWVGQNQRVRIELTQLGTRTFGHPWVAACAAPEIAALPLAGSVIGFGEAATESGDAAADVYAVGALLELLATAGAAKPSKDVQGVIREATVADPDMRPSMAELVHHIAALDPSLRAQRPSMEIQVQTPTPAIGVTLGRYELVNQLGAGAMGEVWEARDTTGNPNVAIKLLRPEIARDAELLRRFRKEARVLAKVGSPHIANMIDLNEDRGLHYLVLELVGGGSVGAALKRQGKFPEALALAVVADACRALAEPHRLGIVHRDLKPDNMMFVRAGIELESFEGLGQVIKLGDFGIARVAEKESDGSTRAGSVLGTPEFMAPEQCQGAQVTPATDVYALGGCLFALIAGRPPFLGENTDTMGLIFKQVREQPPRLDQIQTDATPAIADLVERCLAKDPQRRFADATELLVAIESLCGGTPALMTAHPAPPIVKPNLVQKYALEWELKASPEQLWPFISNTEKINRATGLAPVRFEIEAIEGNTSKTTGNQKVAGLSLKWREHPYEWIEGTRHVVLRVFEKGVLRWYVAEVSLEKLPGGGTKLRNTVMLEPRGLLARVLSRWEIGVKYKKRLDKVYTRLDNLLAAGVPPEIDPIDPVVEVSAAVRARVQEIVGKLHEAALDDRAIESLAAYVLSASEQDVARIRPLALAERFSVSEDAMIEVCLHAAKLGMLAMVWDVICPSCRIPSNIVESLAKIEQHARCKTCQVGFDVDFSRAVELVFRVAPEIRGVEMRTFCIGGPAHFPHVAAQVRLAPNERVALQLALSPGFYLLRSPQLPRVHELRVTANGGVRRHDLLLSERSEVALLTAGDQLLTVVNQEAREVLIRVERAGDRAHALTAARAMATSAFRELFPDQQLGPGRLMAVAQATLVVAQIDGAQTIFHDLGDAKAFPVASRFFEQVNALARESGGSLVKTFGGLAIAGFERPGPAVDVALALQAALDAHPTTTGLVCRIAVHRGPMMALTQAGRLDYFGSNVELVLSLLGTLAPGVIGITQAVCQEPEVTDRLKASDQLGMAPIGAGSWMMQVKSTRGAPRLLGPAE
jgi:serine/threonine protein kinase/class 3 adenylate cyclase